MDEKAFLDRLDRHIDIMQKMLDIMPRPAGKLTRVMETVVLITSAFGFIVIADVIMNWFK
uniref:Uncharacterized protein n=1 Tax=uncultured bacterium contig00023 TaxID=1181512 RepID=A0A806KDB5_9BACT|nr:hypothetical protein [uncultured bacterium contig00023]